METEKEQFYQRLKRIRENRGLSVRDVSEHTGVPISTYREWENGRAIQGATAYALIARALRVSLHELLTGEAPLENRDLMDSLEAALDELEKLRVTLLSRM